jgi:hypothetical protein
MINEHKTLVGKPEGKRPIGRHKRRWKNTIRMDLKETGWEDVDWMQVFGDRNQWRVVVNTVIDLRVP